MTVKTKRCSRCGETKEVSEYYAVQRASDGLCSWCKACKRQATKDRESSDPERIAAMRRAAYARRRSGEAEANRLPAYGTPERAWRMAHQARIRAAKQQAKRFGAAVNDLHLRDWLAILEAHKNTCFYCQKVGSMWIEHMVPLFKGGDNTATNVVPACEDCNRRKRLRTVDQFVNDRCSRDHDMTADNVYVTPDGKKRVCRTCQRESWRRFRARHRPNKRKPQPLPRW